MAVRDFINVVSTKRSGHHAFIYWLKRGLPGPVHFENNLAMTAQAAERVKALAQRPEDTVILNTEGVTPAGVARLVAMQQETGVPARTVIFLRDPLNFAASLLRRKRFRLLEIAMIARQLTAQRDWLRLWAEAGPDPRLAGTGLNLCFYNPWLRDEAYRAGLADIYGLRDSSRLEQVSPHGGGSSYGDIERGDNADAAQKLLHRWKSVREDTVFQALVTHPAFEPWYRHHLAGEVVGSLGMRDTDEERLAFFDASHDSARRHALLDRVVSNLAGDATLYQRIESVRGKRRKRLIARATIGALLRAPDSGE